MGNNESTIALSLVIHGEAVRLNRGKAQADGFDFKYMSGKGGIFPYVSSQCFKKYWRESLPQPYSPITRGKNAAGNEKNQVYTEGNPIVYMDDDLFGYMRAGANSEETQSDSTQDEAINPDQADAEVESFLLDRDGFQNKEALLKQVKSGKGKFYEILRDRIPSGLKEEFGRASKSDISDELLDALIAALNEAIQQPSNSGYELKGAAQKAVNDNTKTHSQVVSEFINKEFGKALRPTQPTTKRTSPIRMHALVAFSGISMAKDFQTFARDTAHTDKNAVLNPNPVGIYSGWLKTRILIEGQRIGKFDLGPNRDVLPDQLAALAENVVEQHSKNDPYSRDHKQVDFVQLDINTRVTRMQHALRALADIGNRQGPASGALHDGSLRPKGFIGAFMDCADSPFDAVWREGEGANGLPMFDLIKLKAMLLDWEDLFASRTIYIGWPVEMPVSTKQLEETLKGRDMEDVAKLGFTFVVDTPRRALLRMAEDVAHEDA